MTISQATDWLLTHPDTPSWEYPSEFSGLQLSKTIASIKHSSLLRSPRFKKFSLDNCSVGADIATTLNCYLKQLDQATEHGIGLYLWSDSPGSGKTTLMRDIAVRLLKTGKGVLFESMVNIKNKLKEEFDSPTHLPFRHKLNAVDVLILDDLGSEIGSKWLDEVMKDIIDERYNQVKILMITANYPLEKLPFDKKIIDRLRSMLKPIHFPEHSFRTLGI